MADRYYHYTTPQAFLNIIQSKRLWMRDARQMNDSRELMVARDLMLRAVGADQSFIRFINQYEGQTQQHEYYVACFSKLDNQLSQWRGYAADGAGVCLEFELDAKTTNDKDLMFSPVTYYAEGDGESSLVEMVKELETRLQKPLGHFLTMVGNDDNYIENIGWLLVRLNKYLAMYKDSGFREEQECRLVYYPIARSYPNDPGSFFVDDNYDFDFKFSVIGSDLYKCFELPFGSNSDLVKLTGVRKGPKCSFQTVDIAELIHGAGLDPVRIIDSGLSYR